MRGALLRLALGIGAASFFWPLEFSGGQKKI